MVEKNRLLTLLALKSALKVNGIRKMKKTSWPMPRKKKPKSITGSKRLLDFMNDFAFDQDRAKNKIKIKSSAFF